MLSTRPEAWTKEIKAYTKSSSWENRGDLMGKLNKVSKHAKDVSPGSHIVIVCSPAQTKLQILTEIKEYLSQGCLLGSVFG